MCWPLRAATQRPLAWMTHTLAAACLDHDSPPDAPQPFFTGGVDEVLHGVDEATLRHVFEAFVSFTGEHCAELHSIDLGILPRFLDDLATAPMGVAMALFDEMSPGLRFVVTRTLLAHWQASRGPARPAEAVS
jgi:hypothetical protein